MDEHIDLLAWEAFDILTRNRDKLDNLAKALEILESLNEADVEELIGTPAHKNNGMETSDEK